MYARVVTVHVQPGKMDEFLRRFRELVPAVQAIRGFHEALLLTDAHTGTVTAVTVWETEADAKAAPVGGAEGGPLRDLLTKPAVVAYYELSMEFARDTGSF
jgi:Antibiotic biosynthesis monooxygenase